MKTKLLLPVLVALLAAPATTLARPATTPDPRKDNRPPIVEKMDTADFTCATGQPVGVVLALAGLALTLRRRR
jgi:uncharacterized protein (TIGR03382 family)